MTNPPTDPGYDAAGRSVALADRADRARIEVAGPDRARVLHNLTTNDVKRLAPGRGCEAFLTSGQGRTIGFLLIHAEADRLLVRSDPGTAGAILAHLAKYAPFEDATAVDVSAETAEWHLAGPSADALARSLGLEPPDSDLGLATAAIDGRSVRVVREGPTGRPGLTLVAARADAPAIADALRAGLAAHGGSEVGPEAFEAMRIEAGTPAFGRDVTEANLPQEVDRDARAISFVKGCYLGQETVARLDALGHVNKVLFAAVAEDARVPAPGSSIRADGKDVGIVTSSAYSPGWSRAVVLGVAKVAHAGPGSALVAISGGDAIPLTVRARPMLPPDRPA